MGSQGFLDLMFKTEIHDYTKSITAERSRGFSRDQASLQAVTIGAELDVFTSLSATVAYSLNFMSLAFTFGGHPL